ncbi:hypothetical protein RFI_24122 [Reticulomyxa filosa]|uniref:Uncharacterized protein n=1 Tax=Reticulomyxa filosa TaxID=46433 RepID=X6MHW5_RETFI|nr:hypothetical protein RFI_24122 [Reticulomyxa filosa]|eukprot:ETO13251.1 hypothetical protein RFI_24122 [Reticulomyxa filosa]
MEVDHDSQNDDFIQPSFQQLETELVTARPDLKELLAQKFRRFRDESKELQEMLSRRTSEIIDRYNIQVEERLCNWEKEITSLVEEQSLACSKNNDELSSKLYVDKNTQTDIIAIKHLASEVPTPVLESKKNTLETTVPPIDEPREHVSQKDDEANISNKQPDVNSNANDSLKKTVVTHTLDNDESIATNPQHHHLRTTPPPPPQHAKQKINYFTNTQKRTPRKSLRKSMHGKKLSFREDIQDNLKNKGKTRTVLTMKFHDHDATVKDTKPRLLANQQSHLLFTCFVNGLFFFFSPLLIDCCFYGKEMFKI